jgi:hypothetical protein
MNLASLICLRPSRVCRRPACLRPYYLRLRMSLRLTLLPSTTPPPVLVVLCDAIYTPRLPSRSLQPAEASHHANHAPCLVINRLRSAILSLLHNRQDLRRTIITPPRPVILSCSSSSHPPAIFTIISSRHPHVFAYFMPPSPDNRYFRFRSLATLSRHDSIAMLLVCC